METTSILPSSIDLLTSTFQANFLTYLDKLGDLPGGHIILRYIKSSYQDDPMRSLFELLLVVFVISYFLSSKRKEKMYENAVQLKKKDIDELCDEWQPEPLVSPVESNEKWIIDTIPIIQGKIGPHLDLTYNDKSYTNVINLASFDFLNLNGNKKIVEAAKYTIRNSGVGACGPPNFYGTQDSHVRLEEDLAEYFDAEAAILYGQDFCTAPSVIPAFLKRGDVCVADSGVSLAIQKALVVSRCNLVWYDHNDYEHLEDVLMDLKTDLDARPINRRFIVTEGLFGNFGDLPDLPKLIELKKKFKYRLFVDETYSLGVVGKTGKGLAEHFNIPRSEIDITIGSMALSFASSGGFCIGSKPMVHHQRLQSSAYVFSASLPPYSAKVTSAAIKEMSLLNTEGNSIKISSLQSKTKKMYNEITNSKKLNNLIKVISSETSPIIHIRLDSKLRERLNLPESYGGVTTNFSKIGNFNAQYNLESYLIAKINRSILDKGVLTTRSKRILHHETTSIVPELLVVINDGITLSEIGSCFKIIEKCIVENLKSLGKKDFLSLSDEFSEYE